MHVRQLEQDGGLAGAAELGLAVELPRLVEVPAGEGGVAGALQPGPGGGFHGLEALGHLERVVPGLRRPPVEHGEMEVLLARQRQGAPALPTFRIAGAQGGDHVLAPVPSGEAAQRGLAAERLHGGGIEPGAGLVQILPLGRDQRRGQGVARIVHPAGVEVTRRSSTSGQRFRAVRASRRERS